MKKLFVLIFAVTFVSGCSDDKAQEKSLLDSVIKIHDKLMTDDGVIMKNKMALKPYTTVAVTKDSAVKYTQTLTEADDAMMGWMNKFNPEFAGKTHKQIMDYLNRQKAQIVKLDSQINSAVNASDKYLNKIKTK